MHKVEFGVIVPVYFKRGLSKYSTIVGLKKFYKRWGVVDKIKIQLIKTGVM